MARDYAELNTNLDSNQATVVPSLNGRQGDANREVYFWLKDGKTGVNLQGKTITLFAKDASGVVKTASTMNDTTGLSAGRFSLIIPAEFYQAEGTVQDSYLQVKNGDAVITTIPVSFQVLENTMLVTQTQSQLFLDTVQSTIDDFNSRIATTTTNLTTVENAQKALQVSIDNINSQFNSDLFAQKAKDNEFKGNNTFDGTATFQQKIVVPNGVQGKADSAVQADTLNQTIDQKVQSITAKNWSTFSSGLESFSGFKSHGWANFDYLAASGNVDISGLVNGQQKVYKTNVYRSDLNAGYYATRIGSLVKINIYSNAGNVDGTKIESSGTIFGDGTYNVPAGFRPTTIEAGHFVGDSQNGSVVVWQDGGISVNRSFITQNTYWSVRGSIIYYTADAFPNS